MPGIDNDKERREIGLPSRVFTFTIDQIAAMLAVDEKRLRREFLYYARRSVGKQSPRLIYAVNINPDEAIPEWRVTDREFIRYCKHVGFRAYDLTSAVARLG